MSIITKWYWNVNIRQWIMLPSAVLVKSCILLLVFSLHMDWLTDNKSYHDEACCQTWYPFLSPAQGLVHDSTDVFWIRYKFFHTFLLQATLSGHTQTCFQLKVLCIGETSLKAVGLLNIISKTGLTVDLCLQIFFFTFSTSCKFLLL